MTNQAAKPLDPPGPLAAPSVGASHPMEEQEIQRQLDGYAHRASLELDQRIQATSAPNHEGVIEGLLLAGVDPNHGAKHRNAAEQLSLLGFAVDAVDEGAVEALLRAGADPNRGVGDTTPLCLACRRASDSDLAGLARIGLALIRAGCDIDASPQQGLYPMLVAFDNGNDELALTLALAGSAYTPNPYRSADLLARAALRGNVSLAVQLLATALARKTPGLDEALAVAVEVARPLYPLLAESLLASARSFVEGRELADATPMAGSKRKVAL